MPESGPLPGTVVETLSSEPNANTETSNGPAVSELSEETDFIRPSVLTVGSDRRSKLERLAASQGGEHHMHLKCGQHVKMYKPTHWAVSS